MSDTNKDTAPNHDSVNGAVTFVSTGDDLSSENLTKEVMSSDVVNDPLLALDPYDQRKELDLIYNSKVCQDPPLS